VLAVDPVATAIEHILLVQKLAKKAAERCKIERNLGAAIQRRAKDLPGMVYTIGFIPTITFYMSKVENSKLYSRIYRLLVSGDEKQVEDIVEEVFRRNEDNSLCKEMGANETAGYATLLAMTAAALARARVLEGDISSLQGLASSLKTLRERRRVLCGETTDRVPR